MDRRARRHEATRGEILDAAWQLARHHGLTGWTLRELAAAVQMQPPSLYGYFAGKQAIYDAMFSQGYQQLLALQDDVPEGDPVARLHWVAQRFVSFAVADPARLHLLFLRVIPDFEPSAEAYALAEDVLGLFRGWCADAGITDEHTVDLWTATLTGIATQQVSNDPGGDRWTRLVDDAVELLLSHQPEVSASRAAPTAGARPRSGDPSAADT